MAAKPSNYYRNDPEFKVSDVFVLGKGINLFYKMMLTAQFWAMRANTHPHLAGKSKKSGRKYRISSNRLLTKCVETGKLAGAGTSLFLYQKWEIEVVYWTFSYSPLMVITEL